VYTTMSIGTTAILGIFLAFPASASQSREEHGEKETIVVRTGIPMRPLPFELGRLADRRPQTLQEVEDEIYAAVPDYHLQSIATYLSEDQRRARVSPIDRRSALYGREIMAEAWRLWGFTEDRDPFAAASRCVGPDFSHYLTLRLGFRFLREHPSRRRGASTTLRGYRELERAMQRLFDICEQRATP